MTQSNLNKLLHLVIIKLKFQIFSFVEYVKVIFYYYSDLTFFKIDLSLLSYYFFSSPFAISKRFLLQKGEKDIYTYGETPLTTLDFIAQQCQFTLSDTIFELGCGRGRTCFWLNRFIGCQVIGVDYIAEFIQRAQQVQKKYGIDGVEFRLQNLMETDLARATVIYLYGTCYSRLFIKQLINRFKSLPQGTKIITVSYPLSDYQDEDLFKVIYSFMAPFSWGSADVYVQVKR